MADKLGINTSDEIVYRVKLLRQRHDELVEQLRKRERDMEAAATARKYRKIAGICRSIKPKYEYTGEMYSIVVPSGVRDIMREGDALSHCVGKSDRYWERIEQQEAYILFLRKTAEIDKPYYTLEVEPNGTIRQKRTYFDRQNDDLKDAEKFLKEWQKVVSERLTESDREKQKRARSFACRNSSSCDRMTFVSIPVTLPVSGWWMFWCRISWKLRPKPQHNTFEQRKGSYREHEKRIYDHAAQRCGGAASLVH